MSDPVCLNRNKEPVSDNSISGNKTERILSKQCLPSGVMTPHMGYPSHSHTHTHRRAHIRTHTNTYTCKPTHINSHTHAHTYMHTHYTSTFRQSAHQALLFPSPLIPHLRNIKDTHLITKQRKIGRAHV